jgi:threonyl-tRNA synthetase
MHEGNVALRKQGEGDQGQMTIDEFGEFILNEVEKETSK